MIVTSIYDTTLRDGVQMVGLNLSRQDKIEIIKNLVNELAIPYIELYPFSNPKDKEVIDEIKVKSPELLNHLVAFGSTCRADKNVTEDDNLQALVNCGVKFVTIFGKSWDFQLKFIHCTPVRNLNLIEESIRFLKEHGLIVFFDAEHFFEGYKSNPDYAIQTLLAAGKGGADVIVLCDTNGGSLPHEIYNITDLIAEKLSKPLGIHAHNDGGMADANSISAVQACLNHNRACIVQGTMNGWGERAGNANLITLIPLLSIKMDLGVIPKQKLRNLTSVSNLLFEIANLIPPDNRPFVGYNAFSHKGGIHIAAMEQDLRAYEHIDPDLVGNTRRVVFSEMSGKAALLHKMHKFGISIDKNDPRLQGLLDILKRKESHGYTYEGADASLQILIKGYFQDTQLAATYYRRYYFEVDYFRVITDVRHVFHEEELTILTDANIKTLVSGEEGLKEFHTAAEGNGPVNAIDKSLRKALIYFYPVLEQIELIDYKVRIANAESDEQGTGSRVRVLVISRDKDGEIWGTIGSHVNIIVASFVALLDSYIYKLMKENIRPLHSTEKGNNNGKSNN